MLDNLIFLLSLNIIAAFSVGMGAIIFALTCHFIYKKKISFLMLIKYIILLLKITFFPLVVLWILCVKIIRKLLYLIMQLIEKYMQEI